MGIGIHRRLGLGLSITGPSRSLIESTVLGLPGAAGSGTALIVGIPPGTWLLNARARASITWRAPGWGGLGRRFGGGMLIGMGGTLAAGCNIGNALTGLSVLATNSLIATTAIVTGAPSPSRWREYAGASRGCGSRGRNDDDAGSGPAQMRCPEQPQNHA